MANIIQINGKKVKDVNAARMSSLAPVESSTTASMAHAVGDYFWLNGTLYEATAAITIGNAISVGTNCKITNMGENLADLKSALKYYTVDGEVEYSTFLQGNRSTSAPETVTSRNDRCTTGKLFHLYKGDVVNVTGIAPGHKFVLASNTGYDSGWKTGNFSYTVTGEMYIFGNEAASNGSDAILPSSVTTKIEIVDNSSRISKNEDSIIDIKNAIEYIEESEYYNNDLAFRSVWQSGGWRDIATNPAPTTNNTRIRMQVAFTCVAGSSLTIKGNSDYDYVYCLYKNGTKVSALIVWTSTETTLSIDAGTYTLYAAIRHDDTTELDPSDVLNYGIIIKVDQGNSTEHQIEAVNDRVSNVEGLLAPTEASATASRAYAVGEHFIYNNFLYVATEPIASGGTIAPNINCKADTVGSEIYDMNVAVSGKIEQLNLSINDLLIDAEWESGGWRDMTTNPQPTSNATRIRTLITFTAADAFRLEIADIKKTHVYSYAIISNGTNVVHSDDWTTSDSRVQFGAGTYSLYLAIKKNDVDALDPKHALYYGITCIKGQYQDDYSYVSAMENNVRTKLNNLCAISGNTAIFGFNTDQHVEPGNKEEAVVRGLNVLKRLTWTIPFDFVSLGGDSPGSIYTRNDLDEIVHDSLAIQEPLHDAFCPVVPITGNHDAQQNNSNMTGSILYNIYFKRVVNMWKDFVALNNQGTNGYWDSVSHKIRFVFFDDTIRTDYSWTTRSEALSALISNTPNDYKIIIISHHVISDAVTNPLWANPIGIQARLASYKDKIICCVCGHSHADISEISGGILYIATTMAQLGTDVEGHARTFGTEDETAFDTFVINQGNKTINAIRYGYGADRLWYTEKIELAVAATDTEVSSLTGTVTWSTDNSSVCSVSSGTITGVAAGECLVRATNESGAEECWWVVVT